MLLPSPNRRCVAGTGREEQGKVVGSNGKGEQGCGRENVFKPTIVRDFIFSLKCAKMFGGWAPPGPAGELDPLKPPNRSECHGREHSRD